MYSCSTKIRVRYGETDQMGYVYYGNYALYYEEGRTDAIRQLGITYKSLEEIGVMMPVMRMDIQYLRPAFYDESLTIVSKVLRIHESDTEIIFESEIINEKGKIINKSEIKLAFVDSQTRKKTTVPQELFEKLKPYFD